MSFIYPRTITITRPVPQAASGPVLGYGGLVATSEDPVISGIRASIQLKKEGGRPGADLPGDAAKVAFWRIFFRQPLGTVKKHDIITDDLGVRYQVLAAYWNSLGYAVLAEELGV